MVSAIDFFKFKFTPMFEKLYFCRKKIQRIKEKSAADL